MSSERTGSRRAQPPLLAFAVIAAMMALFIGGRLRCALVALLAPLASIMAGPASPTDAFSGSLDDIVVIVWSAPIVSAAVARDAHRISLTAAAPHGFEL